MKTSVYERHWETCCFVSCYDRWLFLTHIVGRVAGRGKAALGGGLFGESKVCQLELSVRVCWCIEQILWLTERRHDWRILRYSLSWAAHGNCPLESVLQHPQGPKLHLTECFFFSHWLSIIKQLCSLVFVSTNTVPKHAGPACLQYCAAILWRFQL